MKSKTSCGTQVTPKEIAGSTFASIAKLTGRKKKCPKCGNRRTVKKGKILTAGIIRQRYTCRDCGEGFYDPPVPPKIDNLAGIKWPTPRRKPSPISAELARWGR